MAKVRKLIRISRGIALRAPKTPQMIVYKEAGSLKEQVAKRKLYGKTVGFVPTMGALHTGHISLINASRKQCDITIASIFVNPAQFNDLRDYEKYPVTISNDILLLERAGCDILFIPSVNEMYPDCTGSNHHYELGDIEFLLEGKYRPGHFQGVCLIVHKLLAIVVPDFLFMGQKDYQQLLVVRRLVKLYQLPVKLIAGSTSREASGLAMSSRNLRLSDEQRQKATGIFTMLQYLKCNLAFAPPRDLEDYATNYLLNNGFEKVDYVSIADANTLQPLSSVLPHANSIALVAAFMADVRLIDNLLLGV